MVHKREFAWRHIDNPYHVFISEVMLQQTQTSRVEQKYAEFLEAFPDVRLLASASLRDVLAVWQGLGYNRRGKFLHETAKIIVAKYDGLVPDDPVCLVQLPGIGPHTAASICAFAYNKPTIFIETNIRTVFIHSFFKDELGVHDKQLLPLVAATVDQQCPRDWYYALMDYGVHLKRLHPNPSRKSKHHTIQSKFEGSDRQIRGMILKLLLERGALEKVEILAAIDRDTTRIASIMDQLCQERLICVQDGLVCIA